MTADDLAAALRACATGICAVEAGVALLISNETFLHRDDFTSRFIEHGTSDGNTDGRHRLGRPVRHRRPEQLAASPAPAANAASSS